MIQLLSIGISLVMAIVSGLLMGCVMNMKRLCSTPGDVELFEDGFFWNVPDPEERQSLLEPVPSPTNTVILDDQTRAGQVNNRQLNDWSGHIGTDCAHCSL